MGNHAENDTELYKIRNCTVLKSNQALDSSYLIKHKRIKTSRAFDTLEK